MEINKTILSWNERHPEYYPLYCKCGNKAEYISLKLCKKCYLRRYYNAKLK